MTLAREIADRGHLVSNPNLFINGAFDIWQRGTSFSGAVYGADRWLGVPNTATLLMDRVVWTPGNEPEGSYTPLYFIRLRQTVAPSSGQANFQQRIEDVTTVKSGPVTISFWARAETADVVLTPGTVQYFGVGGSTGIITDYDDIVVAHSVWSKYTITIDLPTIVGSTVGTDSFLTIFFRLPATGTHEVKLAAIKAERGAIATPFIPRPAGEELALCQRYYEKSYTEGTVPGSNTTVGLQVHVPYGASISNNFGYGVSFLFAVAKRAIPTVTIYSKTGTAGRVSTDASMTTELAAGSGSGAYLSTGKAGIVNLSGGAVSITNNVVGFHWVADAEL